MRTSFVAGISLVLVLGCGNEETANPGTGTPGATGGNTSGAKDTTAATTKPSSTKGGATGKGGSSSGQNAKGGTSESKASEGGASDGGASDQDPTGGTGGKKSSANPSTGGKVNNTAVGGKSSVGGKSGVGGSSKSDGGAGGAATGGKTSGNPSTGGTSSTKTSGGNTGGTVSSTTTQGSGNTTAASFKCDNLSAAAGSAGQAKPSGTAGGIKVLDWAGFKGAISYTFDDANSSQINNYKALNDTGGKFTFYLQTNKSEAGNSIWQTALNDGHELGNHTADHTQSNSGSGTTTAQSFIQSKFNVTAYAFAAPYGDVSYKSVSSKFLTNRSVSGGSMSAGDTGSLPWMPADIPAANNPTTNLTPTAGKWRVICIHGFQGGSDSAYEAIPLSSFTTAAKSAVTGGFWVTTATNVASYQVGQAALKSGGTKITWSKPAVFPPNQCVRITTTGGTVKQKGAEVPWDDHGYYQISLDAGEVTVE